MSPGALTPYRGSAGLAAAAAAFSLAAGLPGARWWWVAGALAAHGILTGAGVCSMRLQFFGRSICRVRADEPVASLTFDDGPDPEGTPGLLDLLGERGVAAAFFCVGERVAMHPALARRIVAEGHLACNHSHRHHPLTNLFGVDRLAADLARAQEEIGRHTGRMPRFFRPPMGLTNPRVFRVAHRMGLVLVGWTARGLDTRERDPRRVSARLIARLVPGAILALHDGGGIPAGRVLSATRAVLDGAARRGYRLVRLDRLIDEGAARAPSRA